MSQFKIGHIDINRISGPVKVIVLKPPKSLKDSLEKEGARAPYLLLFGDEHYGRENSCNDCDCGWDEDECCYHIDDPKFLNLFDKVITQKLPIDLYIEQAYEPRLGEPNIYDINPKIKTIDDTGFLSKFIHQYKICYSKPHRGTPRYLKECPTKDIRWHFIDIRNIEYGNSGEKKIISGIDTFYKILLHYFNKDKKYLSEDTYSIMKNLLNNKHKREELSMLYYLIINGPNFFEEYVVEDSNFLIAKQIKKQVISPLNDFSFWHKIFRHRIEFFFMKYFSLSTYTYTDYSNVIDFYKKVLILVFDASKKTRLEFEVERLELINSIEKYELFDSFLNLHLMLTMTTLACMVDIYTITRIFKKPKEGISSFLSLVYAGEYHVENIKNILVQTLGYTIIGETNSESRCQDVSHINFNLTKVKSEYIN